MSREDEEKEIEATKAPLMDHLIELRGRLIRFSEEGPEQARIATDELFSTENRFKARYGQFAALSAPGFIDAKRQADLALKARVEADPRLKAQVGDPWTEIARVAQALRERHFAGKAVLHIGS